MTAWVLLALATAQAADGETALVRMRRAWLEKFHQERLLELTAHGRCSTHSHDPLAWQWRQGLTELRLFAGAYPDIAEAWARQAAVDEETVWERRPAVHVLGYLAAARCEGVDGLLARIAGDDVDPLRRLALSVLVEADLYGRHRELYKKRARAAESEAIQALSTCPDPEGVDILLDLGTVEAWESLERIAGFGSKSRVGFLKQCIMSDEGRSGRREWAIRMARRDRAPWLLSVLSQALDRDASTDPPGSSGLLLQALAESGGWVSSENKARLRRYGYLCEPRERLAEVLDEKAYPR